MTKESLEDDDRSQVSLETQLIAIKDENKLGTLTQESQNM